METLTINRIGEPKTINFTNKKTGKPDSFQKVGFLTNEYPDRWHDLSFRGQCPIQVGQSYDLEISSREYNGKQYYDAKLPNKGAQSSGDLNRLEMKLDAHFRAMMTELQMIRGKLDREPLADEFIDPAHIPF